MLCTYIEKPCHGGARQASDPCTALFQAIIISPEWFTPYMEHATAYMLYVHDYTCTYMYTYIYLTYMYTLIACMYVHVLVEC